VSGKLALVTGGHRRLGAAIAARLAREGYAVAIHGSHDADPVADLAAAFSETGAAWHGFVADFSDPDTAEVLMAQVAARFGRAPDLLVNSAAMFGQDDLATVQASDLMAHYAVNCAAPALLTKAFAALGGAGRSIVNLLDQRIFHPHRDQFAYTLSKQALAGLTLASARVLAPAIRVNAIAPGLTIVTDDYADGQSERLAARMPLARLPHAGEIADAVLYFARADAVTGQILSVDGGAHMVAFDRDFLHLDR
jgi:NAD(P)-dependent dehydrogenase (short-subunit alcohol dehydrogenase family)